MEAEEKPKKLWVHFPAQIIIACVCVFWYFKPPAPNKAVLALTLVTVVMALYEMRAAHKAVYLTLVLALVFIENRAIDNDHKEMAKTLSGIEQSVQKVFDKTEQAADTATDAVNTITGGKGFCYIQLATVDVLGKKTDRLVPMLTVQGSKVLWHVTAHVVDYKAFQADRRPLNKLGDVMDRDAVNTTFGDMKIGPQPVFQPIGIITENKTKIDYLIDFWALNGTWTEEMHYRHTHGALEYANQVIWKDFPPDGNVDRVTTTVVFKEISKGYPRTNGEVDWVLHTH